MTEFSTGFNKEVAPETERPISTVVKLPYLEEIYQHPSALGSEFLADQIDERAACLPSIQNVSETLLGQEDTSLADALDRRKLSLETVRELYGSLSTILQNPDYHRLALYVPFGFLTNPDPSDTALTREYETFKEQYTTAWWSILRYRDPRADFVDGDLPDDRNADLDMVVKAAHLIPTLLDRDIITTDDVKWLIEQAGDDEVLQRSIQEAMAPRETSAQDASLFRRVNIADTLVPGTAAELFDHELRHLLANEGDIRESRQRWLGQALRDYLVNDIVRQAEQLSNAEKIVGQLSSGDGFDRQIAIALSEILLRKSPLSSADMDIFKKGLRDDDEAVRAQTILSLQRLCRTRVIAREYLQSLTVRLPHLAGNLSENIVGRAKILEQIDENLQKMMENPVLRDAVHPVVLVEGSTLKGYGTSASDIDIAAFIKPGTPHGDSRIREELARVHGPGVMEFWLDETPDGSLKVHDFDMFDFHEGDSEWTHTLFQSVWVGDDATINDLRQRLLTPYFQDRGDWSRYAHLRRLEQDMLQYRLLQKGYARCYPAESQHDLPDGSSVFWDEGYRLLATRLFTEKVFLPKI